MRPTAHPRSRRGAFLSVGLVTVALVVVVTTDSWGYVVPMIAVALVGGPIVAVDLVEHRIPTVLVQVLAVVLAVWALWTAITDGAWWPLGRGLVVGLLVAGLFWIKWFIGGTGRGDLRLAAVLAAAAGWLGWAPAVGSLVIPYLLAFPLAVWRLARKRRDERIPFGPALVAGWFVAISLHLWMG
ncbi:prepilin peptidase [Antribacter gilvus]|uniref:prepilin peptidase n=1 Tax=Antribacter gilvus TaxID=2304675 RepID=UPI000F7A7BFE|nr:prepilin peptidase [Antribacter gilvus]